MYLLVYKKVYLKVSEYKQLGIYLEKTIVWKDTCTPVFIAALFTYGSQDVKAA